MNGTGSLSARRELRSWRRVRSVGLGIAIAILTLELVYRLVALPPDYGRDRHEAALLATEVQIETAAQGEPPATDVGDLLVEPAAAVLTLSRRLELPLARAADVLAIAPMASTETGRAAERSVVGFAPLDDAPALRLTRRIEGPTERAAAVLGPPPAAGELPPSAAIDPAEADAAAGSGPVAAAAQPRSIDTAGQDHGPLAPELLAPGLLAEELVPVVLPAAPRNLPPPARGAGEPLVAIVIDDMGYSPAALARLATMPGPLTLAFLPYADATPGLLEAARRRDFELVLHLPMEPLGDANPGPEALMVDLDEAELRRRVRWAIDQVPGAVGVNNHMGSRFTADARGLEIVMEELRQRRLYFVDSRTNPTSLAERVARAAGIPTTGRDIFIDHDPTPAAIARQIAAIERFARYSGSVIAIGHPYPTTLAALDAWLPTLAGRGFRLARLSEVLAQRLCATTVNVIEPCGPGLHLVGHGIGSDGPTGSHEPAEAAR